MQPFIISTDKNKLNIPLIHRFLSTESYWAKDIPYETVKKTVQHSLTFGVYENEEQIGFARVITDFTTFAYLADVFILPSHRGKGLSKKLLQTIMEYPELQGLRRWMLATADAHGLYEQFGWTSIKEPARWMEIHAKDIYLSRQGNGTD
jgi:GNAT superfamily N-acetyltransferase